jgi:hypothetical protein
VSAQLRDAHDCNGPADDDGPDPRDTARFLIGAGLGESLLEAAIYAEWNADRAYFRREFERLALPAIAAARTDA